MLNKHRGAKHLRVLSPRRFSYFPWYRGLNSGVSWTKTSAADLYANLHAQIQQSSAPLTCSAVRSREPLRQTAVLLVSPHQRLRNQLFPLSTVSFTTVPPVTSTSTTVL
ncbi:hypothetical protein SRHO_G00047790 [Serrasalmus rhombeus]